MEAAPAFIPEYSFVLALEDIGPEGSELRLEADAGARERLAERFGLLSLDKLVADLTVTRGASGIPIRVRGRLEASVVQECVISLDPVSSEIKELIEVEYVPGAEESLEEELSLDQPDPPEPLDGDSLELGELVAQHLSVGLDPYPRKDGAEAPEWSGNGPEAGEEAIPNPFSVLEQLRKKDAS
jgi:uncharacterized metal-binding protein YceD (DUF177 family)